MNLDFHLDDNQKKVVYVAGAGVAALLFLWTVILPKLGVSGLDDKIAAKQHDLREMLHLYQDFEQVKKEVSANEIAIRNNKGNSLLSELSAIADKLGIKGGIESMNSKPRPKNEFYQEESVEIRLQKINTEELTRLLYEIETSPKILRVRKTHVESRFDDPNLLNVVLEVSLFQPLTE